MPAKTFRWAVSVAIVAMALGAIAEAQVAAPCATMAVGAMSYGVTARANAPYSSTVKTSHEQKLADGNAIHTSSITHQMRDSAGRTRWETWAGCVPGPDGQLQPMVHVLVNDPVTNTSLSWSENDRIPKVVHVYHRPELVPPVPSAETTERQEVTQARRQQQVEVHHERLGSKTIEGVMAEGSRTVRTIPAGEQGNDLPLTIIDEVWIAKDLSVAMMRVNDDPRYGKNTTEVVELNRGEPDAVLFAPPAGYKLEEQITKPVTSVGVQ
jgi:hypothetical protein